jgi:hypothetical protein
MIDGWNVPGDDRTTDEGVDQGGPFVEDILAIARDLLRAVELFD